MRLVAGLLMFACGVYLLADAPQGSAGFWIGFALIALGMLGVARSGRRRAGDGARRAAAGQRVRRRPHQDGGGGDADGGGDGNGNGGGGDGGD